MPTPLRGPLRDPSVADAMAPLRTSGRAHCRIADACERFRNAPPGGVLDMLATTLRPSPHANIVTYRRSAALSPEHLNGSIERA